MADAALDLLAWPDYREAREAFEAELDTAAAEVEAAHHDFDQARDRYRYAPHGQAKARLHAMRAANTRVLAAELAYERIRRREPLWG